MASVDVAQTIMEQLGVPYTRRVSSRSWNALNGSSTHGPQVIGCHDRDDSPGQFVLANAGIFCAYAFAASWGIL